VNIERRTRAKGLRAAYLQSTWTRDLQGLFELRTDARKAEMNDRRDKTCVTPARAIPYRSTFQLPVAIAVARPRVIVSGRISCCHHGPGL